jgi:hypothetical protein
MVTKKSTGSTAKKVITPAAKAVAAAKSRGTPRKSVLPKSGSPPSAPPAPAQERDVAPTVVPLIPLPEGEHAMNRILMIDLAERELQARTRMKIRADHLHTIDNLKETSGGLSADQKDELEKLTHALNKDTPIDEFYRAVASQVVQKAWGVWTAAERQYSMEYGLFRSQQQDTLGNLTNKEQEIAAVCGLLQLDNLTDHTNARFLRHVAEAQGEYRQNVELFNAAYTLFSYRSVVGLKNQIEKGSVNASVIGCIHPGGLISSRAKEHDELSPAMNEQVSVLSAKTIAQIVRRLVVDRVTANDTWLSSRLESAFNMLTGSIDGAPPSAMEIDLPDLEVAVDVDIVKENLHAVQAIYFSYQLEEMRMYQVVERIVELFRQGLLPLGRGRVGDYLYKYYQKAGERITESERRDLYFRCFGAPGGNPNIGEPNRDFNELWMRFLSSVSSFSRQLTVDRLLRSSVPMSVSQEQVRKAGRDLGANLSRNGYGIAYNAAIEMQQSILEFRDVLTDPDLRNVFGARDMWQVIDLVNANYLGGARNTHRYRTQSRNGAIIVRWIANHVQQLSNVAGPVLMIDQIVNPQMRNIDPDHKPTVDPTDWDLVNACEQWLAVGGVQDQSVEQYAQPIEAPITSSRPIGMPQMARDALDMAGISLPA